MSNCPSCNHDIKHPIFRKRRSDYKYYELVGIDMVCPICGVKLAYDLRSRLIATLGICIYILGVIVNMWFGNKVSHDSISFITIIAMGTMLFVSILVRKLEIKPE